MCAPFLSVVVVTYQRGQVLCDTIAHLLALTYPDWELLVVDQTQEHESSTREFLQQASSSIRYIPIQEVGMCHARNVGTEAARGEVILFCDDDVIPHVELLRMHARHYEDLSVGGVTGPVHMQPAPAEGAIRHVPGGQVRRDPFPANLVDTDSVNGCNMSFRRQILLSIGGFDEEYITPARRDETDVSLRVRALGHRLLFDPEARVEHLTFPSGGSRIDLAEEKRFAFGWYHNHAYYFGKHMPIWQLPLFLRYQLGHLLYRQVWQQRRLQVVRPALAGLTEGFWLGRKARRRMLAQLAQANS